MQFKDAYKSTKYIIFGGFADKPWKSSRGVCCESNKAFLFSLKGPSSEVGLTKMRINQSECLLAMFHWSSYGPIFGNDLFISSDANGNSDSCSNIGNTYELPPGQTNTFLVGTEYFKVSEIEVFQII